MELSEIAAITGKPGIYKITGRRNDGLIVTSLVDGKTTFVSSRQHLFTTLDNITIYTQQDTEPLKAVLKSVVEKEAELPLPESNNDEALKEWFGKILPEYDREKVYNSDIKKLVKWYELLKKNNLLDELLAAKEEENADDAAAKPKEDGKKEKPASEKPKKSAKPKAETKTGKVATKPAPAAKKVTAPRKAQ